MKKLLSLFWLLTFFYNATSQIQMGADIYGEDTYDESGMFINMPDLYTVAIPAHFNDGNGLDAGHVRVYRWNGNAWLQKGADIDGEAAFDNSGSSISMPDSNTLAVGANNNTGAAYHSGHVRVFSWNGSAWIQKGGDIDGVAANDGAGRSVSMPDANTVAIGAISSAGGGLFDQGQVRVFTWNGNSWVQKGSDLYGEAAEDHSGISVKMPDNNTVAIVADANDGNGIDAGHVRIYSWNGSAWIQKGADIDGETAGDRTGTVDMPDNNTIAIGAASNDGNGFEAGHVRIYSWNGAAWVQKGSDIDGMTLDWCGTSISMPNANLIAVGSPTIMTLGHTRIFSWNGIAWMQLGVAIAGDSVGDHSGTSVSMPNVSTIAIGAPSNGGSYGKVKIFRLCDHTIDTIQISACNSYLSPSGNYIWTSSGTYYDTIPNAAGCDSLITIHLIVNTVNVSVTNASPNLSANASGAGYQWIYCDSIPIPGAISQNFTATSNGNYAVIVTQNGCSDTSACLQVNLQNVTDNSFGKEISVYPNPAHNEFFFDLGVKYNDVHVTVRNEFGREISRKNYHYVQTLQIQMNTAPGFYFIELKTPSGETAVIKVLKK